MIKNCNKAFAYEKHIVNKPLSVGASLAADCRSAYSNNLKATVECNKNYNRLYANYKGNEFKIIVIKSFFIQIQSSFIGVSNYV